MKQFKFKINGNNYAVEVMSVEDNLAKIEVNGTPYNIELEKTVKKTKTPTIVRAPQREPAKPEIEKKERGTAHAILAPLPGSIMVVKVSAGDIIEKGQLLMVMEAMKMENQVLADRKGVVEKIHVGVGDTVLQGDKLLELI